MTGIFDLLLEPFDPKKHKPKDVGLGGPSTEYLATEEAPSGGFWNIPQIWYDRNGTPHLLDADAAWMMARDYEAATGKRFPRFETPGAGSFNAMNRSAQGGGALGLLADWGKR